MTVRSDRGINARRPVQVLLSEEERRRADLALSKENRLRQEQHEPPVGLGTKLRQLMLRWTDDVLGPKGKKS